MGLTIALLTLLCPLAAVVTRSDFGFSATTEKVQSSAHLPTEKESKRALITGNVVFSDDASQPLDLIVSTIEPNIPQDMYCNQVVLGNAFFGSDEIKERKNGQLAVKIGTTLDNSDVTTWLFLETHESRKSKLNDRIRKGRPICVQGYFREYRKEGDTSPYRAIVASDFTTRKDQRKAGRRPEENGSAAGYAEVDPTPDY